MSYHEKSAQEIAKELGVDIERGLDGNTVQQLRERHGANRLEERKRRSVVKRFFDQFKDAMILILIGAAAISFAVALHEQHAREFIEPALIMLIVILNAVMGLVQEQRAQKALDALKELSAPRCRVIREGRTEVVPSEDIVPGDIMLFEAGTKLAADGRLIDSQSLKVDESPLTGESVPVEKDAESIAAADSALGDRLNMVYAGCTVTYGRGLAIVVSTGMGTEMGKIASMLELTEETKTPLQERLSSLGKLLAVVALLACVAVLVVGLLFGLPFIEIFMISVSLAVSAIPEGLPAIVTIVLSLGVQRMAKKHAIIRRLPAVETLGSASVICSDKTGTLTQNRMTLVEAFVVSEEVQERVMDHNSNAIRGLLRLGTLCCDATETVGDPTETAIVAAASKNGMTKAGLEQEAPRVAEIPFDSERKLMSTVHAVDGRFLVVVKGAFDSLVPLCGQHEVQRSALVNARMGEQALRVLGIASKWIDAVPEHVDPGHLEHSLTLEGLVGMIDPPREEAKHAVDMCRSAGIKAVMITGDHIITAKAIARQIGILMEGDEAISGADLAKMDQHELNQRVTGIAVYARVSPADKIRIVQAWQAREMVVAMTGDGVNDAPALKSADIGCAMGITGTDVAKEASDMTLSDDNFATIVEAVREGRIMYDNIRKAVGFLLGTNIGELLTVFIAMMAWHVSPFLSMQLLWINLVTDSFPAIALGTEGADRSLMQRPPRSKGESLFAHGLGLRIMLQGVLFALLSLGAFHYGRVVLGSLEAGRTAAFLVLAISQILHSFNMRSDRSLFTIGFWTNRALNRAALLSLALIGLIAFIPPIAGAFGMLLLPLGSYVLIAAVALVPIIILEITKAIGLVKPHA